MVLSVGTARSRSRSSFTQHPYSAMSDDKREALEEAANTLSEALMCIQDEIEQGDEPREEDISLAEGALADLRLAMEGK